MIKILKFFIYICIIVIPVVWLSNYPGEVNILWKNYLIETNALGLVAVISILSAVIILFYRIYFYVKNFPMEQAKYEDFLNSGAIYVAGRAKKGKQVVIVIDVKKHVEQNKDNEFMEN